MDSAARKVRSGQELRSGEESSREGDAALLARARLLLNDKIAASRRSDVFKRVSGILIAPRSEWEVIAGEGNSIARLYGSYVMPMAAIAPLCKLLSWSLLFSYTDFASALFAALLAYGLALLGVAVLAMIASRLAPVFEGQADIDRAFKLVAYSATASWLGGIFRLIPGLAMLSVVASCYSIYILYTGVVTMMAIPQDRAAGYAIAMTIAALAVFLVIAVVVTGLAGLNLLGMA